MTTDRPEQGEQSSGSPSDPPEQGQRVVRRGLALLRWSIRAEPWPFAWSVLGAALYATTTVGAALVLGAVTDAVVVPALERGAVQDGAGGLGAVGMGAAAIVAVGAAKSVGIVLRRVGASDMQFRLSARVRREVADAYLRLPPSWHRRHPTGELLSTLNADVEAAFSPIAPLPFSCGVLLLLAVAAAVLAATDPLLAAIGLVLGPALALVNSGYNARSAPPATRAQALRGEVAAVAHESVDGAQVVKTLGREDAEAARFRVPADRLRDEMVALGRIRASFDPLLEALPNVATLAVIVVGAVRVGAGAMSVGDLVRVAYLFTVLAFPFRMIGYLLSEFPRAVVGWDRVQRVLAADEGLVSGRETLDGTGPAEPALDAVSFRYADADVLADVDLRVEPGRTVALVGPTGSGKSTVAALLVRLADPAEGAVLLDGHDLRRLAPGALAGSAAAALQQTFLFDDTVRGNITLAEEHDAIKGGRSIKGGRFSEDEVSAALRLAQAEEFVDALPDGLDTLVGERGATLSGGQRQRLALARALVRRPRLLVLDDATSSVDPAVEAAILRGLAAADLPSTVVLVAYRRASIALADEIVFLAGGRILARGTHAELLARLPAYAAFVAAQDGLDRARAS